MWLGITKMSGEKDSSKDYTVSDVFLCVSECCVSLFSYLGLLAFDRRTICFTQKMLEMTKAQAAAPQSPVEPELFLPSCLCASQDTRHYGKVVIEKQTKGLLPSGIVWILWSGFNWQCLTPCKNKYIYTQNALRTDCERLSFCQTTSECSQIHISDCRTQLNCVVGSELPTYSRLRSRPRTIKGTYLGDRLHWWAESRHFITSSYCVSESIVYIEQLVK